MATGAQAISMREQVGVSPGADDDSADVLVQHIRHAGAAYPVVADPSLEIE